MKKIAFFLVMLSTLICILLISVSAEIIDSGTAGLGVTWTLDDNGVLNVSGNGAISPVKRADMPWIANMKLIKTVVIENGVSGIPSDAFSYSNMEKISIPKSVAAIDLYSMEGCDNLQEIYVDTDNRSFSSDEYGVLFDKKKTVLKIYPEGRNATKYTIPEGILRVDLNAFSSCDKLYEVIFPKSLERIESGTFHNCNYIKSVYLHEKVRYIGSNSFNYCEDLSTVIIKNKDAMIGKDAFKSSEKVKIYGVSGGSVEKFAKENNIPFVELYVGKKNEIVMMIGNPYSDLYGKTVLNDTAPTLSNGRTMLPARFVAEGLGGKVEWIAADRKVIVSTDQTRIEMTVDSNIAYVNGKQVVLDSPVFIKDNRTFTPVRFIAENLGGVVEWLPDSRQVIIRNPNIIDPVVPTVTDAVTYTKKVIEYFGDNKGAYTDTYPPHSIILPKISGDSAVINAINKKIMDDHEDKISILKNNKEANLVYNIEYEYVVDDKILTILISVKTGHQASYRYDEYYVYYYDYQNDKQLTINEYLSAYGKNMSDILSNDALKFNYGYVVTSDKVSAIIIDGNKTFVVYEMPTGFGWHKIEL